MRPRATFYFFHFFLLFIFVYFQSDGNECETDADCNPVQCCVSYQSGPKFCRGKKAKGDDCDLKVETNEARR